MISLVMPPGTKTGYSISYPPLGLLMIASVLEENGHSVEIIDAPAEHLSIDQTVKKIIKNNASVVGISVHDATRFESFLLAEEISKIDKSITIVVGGPSAMFMSKQILLNCHSIDVVVRGEGEYTFLEIADKKPFKTINGITYRPKSGKIIENPPREPIKNLDALPFPARHLLDMNRYFELARKNEYHKRHPTTQVMYSRGCPNSCIYCTTPGIWGRTLRIRSAKNVVEELLFLRDKYGVTDIKFFDDTFNISKKWMYDFFNELKSNKFDISFRCLARVSNADKETLSLMKKCGCYFIEFGVESGSQRILNIINKNITINQVKNAFENARELGIFTKGFFMINLPHENIDDINLTKKLMLELPMNDFSLSICMLLPGSSLFNQTYSDNWFDRTKINSSYMQNNVEIYNGHLGTIELNKIARQINSEVYRNHMNEYIKILRELRELSITNVFTQSLINSLSPQIRRILKKLFIKNLNQGDSIEK